jgi:soluble lytic murein transglycosylase-like protein
MRLRLARWLHARGWRRLSKVVSFTLPRWWRWTLLLLLMPILLLNLTVAWVGGSAIFPLSPFFLKYKLQALGAYAWHRPKCAILGDEPLSMAMLARAEQKNHLPCGLLGAIVQVESGGKPHRISSAGAMGPMQLIPPTARRLGVSDPFDPEQAVDGSARYLHMQFAAFRSIRLAAAAYNAGPGAIVGRKVPQNGQTEIYVQRVMAALVAERHARCVPARRSAASTRSTPATRSTR